MKFIKSTLTAIKNILYLFHLYFKRGVIKTIFYFLTLLIILTVVGYLLEANSKMDKIASQIDQLLPTNRIKVTIPQKIKKKSLGGLISLFKKQKPKVIRTKNFITSKMIGKLKKIDGIEKIIPLHNIDFPMGLGINLMGNSLYFEGIGVGVPAKYAKKFILTRSKRFKMRKGEVPVLVASYIIDILKALTQNSDLPFKINRNTFIGFRFNAKMGSSFLMGNTANTNFNEIVTCRVVGYIDMEYTLGIAFPLSFTKKYKRLHWKNFRKRNYDSLLLDITMNKINDVEYKLKKLGFIVKKDIGLFNNKEISRLLNKNKQGLSFFLKLISFIIIGLGLIIAFYTVLWMLRNKSLEFSLYRFFGSSNFKIISLYGSYLTLINIISIIISYIILTEIFYEMGQYILTLKDQLPTGFQTIFNKSFLLNPVYLKKFYLYSFLFLEASGLLLIFVYMFNLNRKL